MNFKFGRENIIEPEFGLLKFPTPYMIAPTFIFHESLTTVQPLGFPIGRLLYLDFKYGVNSLKNFKFFN